MLLVSQDAAFAQRYKRDLHHQVSSGENDDVPPLSKWLIFFLSMFVLCFIFFPNSSRRRVIGSIFRQPPQWKGAHRAPSTAFSVSRPRYPACVFVERHDPYHEIFTTRVGEIGLSDVQPLRPRIIIPFLFFCIHFSRTAEAFAHATSEQKAQTGHRHVGSSHSRRHRYQRR